MDDLYRCLEIVRSQKELRKPMPFDFHNVIDQSKPCTCTREQNGSCRVSRSGQAIVVA